MDKRAQSSRDCHRLAQAIIQAWPQWFHRHARSQQEDRPWLAEFAKEVPTLQAVNLLRDFLSIVAQREWLLRLDKLVVEGCRQFDAENMAAALKEFLSTTPPPTKYGHRLAEGLPTRDAAWICKLATRGKQGRMSTARLGELCRVAVDRFREQIETQSNRSFRQSGESHETLADLLKAALAVGDEKCFEDLLHLFEANIEYP